MSVLKSKILDLIKQTAKKHGVNIRATCSNKRHNVYKVNVQSCSIDLMGNYLETTKENLEKIEIPYHQRQEIQSCMERTLEGGNEFDHPKAYFSEWNLDHYFSGKTLELVKDLLDCVKCEYEDRSDVMRDYHDVSYYYDFDIGNNKKGFMVSC